MAEPLAILGGAYTDETRPLSSQDTCNYILFPAEKAGTRTEGQLIDAPGLVPFAGVGDGPHRGARDVEGKLFVVSGNKLYQVAPTGVATEIGTIPGTDRVSITHNQIENGNQVLIGTRDNSYVYNTVTGVLAATGVPIFSVDFINQLFVGVDQGRRFWRYSALVDGTDWNSLDNEGAESSPDRIVGLIVSQGEVLVFGERTIEVWANSPNSSTAFQRVQVIERGCASPETICRLDNSVIFLGNDNILYRLEGYSPRPISTHVLTREWGNREPRKAFAFTYEDKGRVIYYLTHKDGQTFGYDVTTGEFHRRESYGFNRWRLNTLVKWAGSWYGGDFADGTLWRLDWRYMKEGCDEVARYRRTGVLSDNQRRVTVNSLELLLDTGRDIEVEEHGPPSISNPLNGAFQIGDVINHQYTITPAYPGQDVTLTVTGDLPTGLTLSASGNLTGTLGEIASFEWAITPSDSCSTGEPLDDVAQVIAVPPISWVASTPSAGYTIKPSTDGIDWSSEAGLTPTPITDDGRLFYGSNGTTLYTNVGPEGGGSTVAIRDVSGVWTAPAGIPSMDALGGDAVFSEGYWFLTRSASGAEKISRMDELEVWSVVGTAPSANIIAKGATHLVALDGLQRQVFHAPLDGSVWTTGVFLAFPFAVDAEGYGNSLGEVVFVSHVAGSYGGGGSGNDYRVYIQRSTDDGLTFALASNPFPDVIDVVPNNAPRAKYDETLGLWLVTSHNRVAYGPTIDALSLSDKVFDSTIQGVGSDGTKFVVSGQFGFSMTVNGSDFTDLTTDAPLGALSLVALGSA